MQMVPAISKVGGDASHGSHRAVAPTGGGGDGRAQIPDVPLAPSCSRALLYTPTPAAAPLDFLLRPRRSHAIRSNIVSMRRRRRARNCGAVYVP